MRFQFVKELGRGGMGCVYEGYDTQTGKIIAIKSMRNDLTCYPEYRELFLSEVDALKRMNHPSVVHIIDNPFQDDKGNMFLPMEYVEGSTICEYVNHNGPFSPQEATQKMLKILDAMKYIHSQRCIHRDIKPSNIMLRSNGEICIIDFGIAKDSAIGSTGKTIGRIVGTNGYMSPEQAGGHNIDLRTDIYSLGCVFYYMLTGRDAIVKQSDESKTICAILNDQLPLPSASAPEVPRQLDEVFMKATDKNMTKRFQTVDEFSRALREENLSSKTSKPKVTVGKNSDNDIIINNPYVSGHHLVISGNVSISNSNFINVEVEDISTNGTGVNGRRVHHQKISVEIDRNNCNATAIMLAGRPECVLDLNRVISILVERSSKQSPVENPIIKKKIEPNNPTEVDNLGCFLKGICFLWPLIGWILYFSWRNSFPNKARQSCKFAWIGFIIGVVLQILIIVINYL